MSEITPFDFNGAQVRVMLINDEPWWVAADVCAVLDIRDTSDAVARLDEADRDQTPVRNSRGELRPMWVISESGLYELVIRSDKPAARPFRRWVTSEVLPAIRKTGRYEVAPATPADDLAVVEHLVAAIRADRQRMTAIEGRQAELEAKVDAADGTYNEFIALAYAKLNGLPTDRRYLSRLGKEATRIMRAAGSEPHKRQDATFGTVNVYPVDVLDEAVVHVPA